MPLLRNGGISRHRLLGSALAWCMLGTVALPAPAQAPAWPDALIGHTEFRKSR
jgi:hypothetical protein